jgi:hypothetical protein
MIDQRVGVVVIETGVPDVVGVHDRVRPVEAWTEATTRSYARRDPAREQTLLHGRHQSFTAARATGRFAAPDGVRAHEQVTHPATSVLQNCRRDRLKTVGVTANIHSPVGAIIG